jgi:hypothetical protein
MRIGIEKSQPVVGLGQQLIECNGALAELHGSIEYSGVRGPEGILRQSENPSGQSR